jgi:glycosyltransferase involved in cell wall biosynthesis
MVELARLVALIVVIAAPAGFLLSAFVATLLGVRRVPKLRDQPKDDRETWPTVTMVVPACDEEREVEAAMRSTLAQEYPTLRIVAVDDRSRDRTGEILDALAASDSRLRAVHVTALPEGWLGKLNALEKGVAAADGDFLLFADADTHLGPDTLKKAISYADLNGVDFLSVLPEIASAGFWGDTVFNAVSATFCLGTRPWKIRDPRSTAIAATGAFMLVRRSAFDRTPGFSWLRLEVADDFGLCLMVKTFGGKCDLLAGRGEVKLRWYASLGEMVVKMQKNFYAIIGQFSLARGLGQAAMVAWLGLFPLALLFTNASWATAVVGITCALTLLSTLIAAVWTGRPLLPSIAWPLGFLLLGFMILRAGIIGHRQGGITWRGVLYPASLLAPAQRVLRKPKRV